MKKTFIVLLIFVSLFLMLFFPSFALTANTWKCGDSVSAELSYEGTLTISGSGEMQDNLGRFYGGPWSTEIDNIKVVKIEDGVTKIGHASFMGLKELICVIIPSSVTIIGGNSFKDCPELTRIVLPDGVEAIEWCVFQQCSGIESIAIPASVVSIGDAAFQGCNALRDIYYGGSEAQWNAIQIDEYNEPLYSATIHFNCTDTAPLEIAGGDYHDLKWVLTNDGTLSISGLGELERETVVDYYTFYQSYPWDVCGDQIRRIIIGEGITSIGPYSFSLNSYSNAVEEVSLPYSLKSIGAGAFYKCLYLRTVTISQNVSEIGARAFSACPELTSIKVSKDNNSFMAYGGILYDRSRSRLLCYPAGKTGETYVIPESVSTIDACAFEYNSFLREVTIPKGVTEIGDNVFGNCSSLSVVTIPNSIGTISETAFYWSKSLQDVYYSGTETQWNQIYIKQVGTGQMSPILPNTTIIHYSNDESIIFSDEEDLDPQKEHHSLKLKSDETLESIVFSTPSTTYNSRLSHLLCVMARSAYSDWLTKENLSVLGFDVDETNPNYYDTFSENIPTPYSIAKKTLSDGSHIVMITIRGSWGNLWEQSWLNNADIGFAALNGLGKHAGFESNANEIFDNLNNMIGGLKSANATYIITGHSQGAAAANLLAVKLYDEGVPSSCVYDYNFACPNVACLLNPNDWNPGGAHDNIFNIGNVEDPVTFLPSNLVKAFVPRLSPLSTWGKFGQSYWFYPDNQNHNVAGHDMVYYVNALSNEYSLNSFHSYSQLSGEYILRVIGVRCPVDVIVFDLDGNEVAGVKDNVPFYGGSKTVSAMAFINEDEKWICLPADQQFEVQLTATEEGEMTYEVYDCNLSNSKVIEGKAFASVPLTSGKRFVSSVGGDTETEDIKLFVADEQGKLDYEVESSSFEIPNDNKAEGAEAAVSANYNGNSYELYNSALTWNAAQAYCESKGGHLAVITSQEEQEFINSILPSEMNLYWIGLSDTDGEWRWVTGESFEYTNWAENEPTGGEEHWAQLYGKDHGNYKLGEWNDCPAVGDPAAQYYTLENTGFICEYEADETANPQPEDMETSAISDNNEVNPANGETNEKQPNSQILLLIIIIGAVAAVLIIILVCLIRKKKPGENIKAKTPPNSSGDAKKMVPSPSKRHTGDSPLARFCPYCGHSISEDALFCMKCGMQQTKEK